jgi:hypothetical protein
MLITGRDVDRTTLGALASGEVRKCFETGLSLCGMDKPWNHIAHATYRERNACLSYGQDRRCWLSAINYQYAV